MNRHRAPNSLTARHKGWPGADGRRRQLNEEAHYRCSGLNMQVDAAALCLQLPGLPELFFAELTHGFSTAVAGGGVAWVLCALLKHGPQWLREFRLWHVSVLRIRERRHTEDRGGGSNGKQRRYLHGKPIINLPPHGELGSPPASGH